MIIIIIIITTTITTIITIMLLDEMGARVAGKARPSQRMLSLDDVRTHRTVLYGTVQYTTEYISFTAYLILNLFFTSTSSSLPSTYSLLRHCFICFLFSPSIHFSLFFTLFVSYPIHMTPHHRTILSLHMYSYLISDEFRDFSQGSSR